MSTDLAAALRRLKPHKRLAQLRVRPRDALVHADDIVAPLLRQWGVFEMEGLDAEGEKARQELAETLEALDAAASRFVEQREAAEAKRAARRAQ